MQSPDSTLIFVAILVNPYWQYKEQVAYVNRIDNLIIVFFSTLQQHGEIA
ncbi:MAG: hypothetical protein WD097_06535 [Balneolales bacterium]